MKPLIRWILKIFFFFYFASISLYFISSAESDDSTKLYQILEKTGDYCERLNLISLHFVCIEEIKERIYYQGRFFKENIYVYDYQLIRKDNNIREQRLLIEKNGKRKHEKHQEFQTKRFWHKYVIFGPIGLLGKSQQQKHDYVIKKNEKFKGSKCFVIEAIPKSLEESDHLYGKAWVRHSDCSVLKIEWYQESMGNIERIEEQASKLGAKPRITFLSEYAFEKNGIRFPNKYSVKEEYVKQRGKLKVSDTTVIYKNYRFFIVETEVKIK